LGRYRIAARPRHRALTGLRMNLMFRNSRLARWLVTLQADSFVFVALLLLDLFPGEIKCALFFSGIRFFPGAL
jgi:hypothetical protein